MNINQKHQHFWSNEFLSTYEKRKLRNSMRFSTFFEYLFWFFSVVLIIQIEFVGMAYPKFFYKESWPFWANSAYETGFFLFSICGYYVGNSHQTYLAYVILHSCYQMKLLAAYIRNGMNKKYETIPLGNKIYCESYQMEAREILMRTIQQYQRLTKLV